jgi:hypothetical protein
VIKFIQLTNADGYPIFFNISQIERFHPGTVSGKAVLYMIADEQPFHARESFSEVKEAIEGALK